MPLKRFCPALWRFLKPIKRRETRGVAAVEFAFVAAPTLFLIFGIIEMMTVFFAATILDSAVVQASRLIRTGQASTSGMTANAFKTEVCNRLYALLSCGSVFIDVRAYPGFIGVTPTDPSSSGTLSAGNMAFQSSSPGDTVLVRAYYSWSLYTPGITNVLSNYGSNSRLLVAASAFRNEPWGS